MPVTVTIDDIKFETNDGTTIMEAAKQAGIHIPQYCYHKRLSIAGCCRICLVEIEGQPKLQIACRTPVAEGMVVHSKSEQAETARRAQLEFLLLHHPIDCPICDQAGECGLQDYYMEFGLHKSRFKLEEKIKGIKATPIGPHVIFDSERCILCTRCVRFCNEIAKENQLAVFERGDHSYIGLFPDQQLDNPYSVNTVDICPVGALTSLDFRFKCRVWFLNWTPSICPGCSNGCNIFIHHRDKVIFRFKPRENQEVNACWLCDAGRLAYKHVNAENRIHEPQLRKGTAFHPISWEEAIREFAKGFSKIMDQNNPQIIGGVASSHMTNEESYLFQKFCREVFKTENIDLLPAVQGYADDFLIKGDKSPNTIGARQMGVNPGLKGLNAEDMLTRSMGLRALYLLNTDAVQAYGHDRMRDVLSRMEFVVLQTSNFNETCQYANLILPGATFAEKEGTFTNYSGTVQKINPAFPPLFDSRADSDIIVEVARLLGHEWSYESPAGIMDEIAGKIKGFQGVTYVKIGERGLIVSQ